MDAAEIDALTYNDVRRACKDVGIPAKGCVLVSLFVNGNEYKCILDTDEENACVWV